MIVLELNEVEIDFCNACKGIWLDSGELELLFDESESLDISNLFTNLKTHTEKIRKCPICYKKMGKAEIGQNKKIIIDKCKKNHGIWFDENELHEIISEVSKKENKILDLLNDIFKYDINLSSTEEE
jgi:hypothetical protein